MKPYIHFQKSKPFLKNRNAARQFRCERPGDHDMPTAVQCCERPGDHDMPTAVQCYEIHPTVIWSLMCCSRIESRTGIVGNIKKRFCK
jgi:hypothetical protein